MAVRGAGVSAPTDQSHAGCHGTVIKRVPSPDGSLLVLSDSGRVYEAGAACQCEAFPRGRPCKHRAAYRLVRLYNSTLACQ